MKRHQMHPYTANWRDSSRHGDEGESAHNNGDLGAINRDTSERSQDDILAGQKDADRHDSETAVEKENVSAGQGSAQDDEALARCKAEMEELRLRTAAEMENFKKRLTREHQEQMRFAAEKVLGDLLPSIDNLDLALQYGSQHEACKDMLQGVAMTRKLLLDALEKNGLKSLGEAGDEFNPEVHEAVGFEPNHDLAPGSVTRVMQRGYKLNDRLLRAAKVMINQ